MEQARSALNTVWAAFKDFPFKDGMAKAALLASLLTAAVRQVLPTAPAFAFDAPVQGSGKTLLAQCVGALAEGKAPTVWPHTAGGNDEEIRKRLFTALRTGSRSLIWDNVVGTFDSAAMAALITSPTMTDRILGRNDAGTVPNRAVILFIGPLFCSR